MPITQKITKKNDELPGGRKENLRLKWQKKNWRIYQGRNGENEEKKWQKNLLEELTGGEVRKKKKVDTNGKKKTRG